MGKSTRNTPARTPARKTHTPPKKFPLFIHKGAGQWAKKHRGKTLYFGRVDADPKGEAALKKWQARLEGRNPDDPADGLTVKELCDRFMGVKDDAKQAGELTRATFDEYHATCKRVAESFGKHRLVSSLSAGDFEKYRAGISKTWGAWRRAGEIQRVRTLFRYGYEAELIEKPVRFGPTFKKPSKATMRKLRADRGPRLFSAAECRAMVDHAGKSLKAFMLLALNCGFGNDDCGRLPCSALDLAGGFVRFPRPKTGIERRCPLWPETIDAIQAAMAKGDRKPSDPVFLTKYGQSWSMGGTGRPVSAEFRKLVRELKLYSKGKGFYTLRHVFRTVADGTHDTPAIDLIMGHTDPSMGGHYREMIDDDRLRAVVDHVHDWLFPLVKIEAVKGGEA